MRKNISSKRSLMWRRGGSSTNTWLHAPSPQPSPPVEERVPEGGVRGRSHSHRPQPVHLPHRPHHLNRRKEYEPQDYLYGPETAHTTGRVGVPAFGKYR